MYPYNEHVGPDVGLSSSRSGSAPPLGFPHHLPESELGLEDAFCKLSRRRESLECWEIAWGGWWEVDGLRW